MSNIEIDRKFNDSEKLKYNIDPYQNNPSVPSITLDDGTIHLTNMSLNEIGSLTGDGRDGDVFLNTGDYSDKLNPMFTTGPTGASWNIGKSLYVRACYFEKIINHPIHGPIIYNVWMDNIWAGVNITPEQTDTFVAHKRNTFFIEGDEIVVDCRMNQHAENEDEVGFYDYLKISGNAFKMKDSEFSDLDIWCYKVNKMPKFQYLQNTLNCMSRVWQFNNLIINDNQIAGCSPAYWSFASGTNQEATHSNGGTNTYFCHFDFENIGSYTGSYYNSVWATMSYGGTVYNKLYARIKNAILNTSNVFLYSNFKTTARTYLFLPAGVLSIKSKNKIVIGENSCIFNAGLANRALYQNMQYTMHQLPIGLNDNVGVGAGANWWTVNIAGYRESTTKALLPNMPSGRKSPFSLIDNSSYGYYTNFRPTFRIGNVGKTRDTENYLPLCHFQPITSFGFVYYASYYTGYRQELSSGCIHLFCKELLMKPGAWIDVSGIPRGNSNSAGASSVTDYLYKANVDGAWGGSSSGSKARVFNPFSPTPGIISIKADKINVINPSPDDFKLKPYLRTNYSSCLGFKYNGSSHNEYMWNRNAEVYDYYVDNNIALYINEIPDIADYFLMTSANAGWKFPHKQTGAGYWTDQYIKDVNTACPYDTANLSCSPGEVSIGCRILSVDGIELKLDASTISQGLDIINSSIGWKQIDLALRHKIVYDVVSKTQWESARNGFGDFSSDKDNIMLREHGETEILVNPDVDMNFNKKINLLGNYEKDKYYKITTTDQVLFSFKGLESIKFLSFEKIDVPEGTDARFLFSSSVTSTKSWFKIDPLSGEKTFISFDNINQGNSIFDVMEFSGNALTNAFLVNNQSPDKILYITIALSTSSLNVTPEIGNMKFLCTKFKMSDSPIPILPENGAEFDNEEVTFVWLQPIQASGSIANRIMVSKDPNFGFREVLPSINENINSMKNGNIVSAVLPPKYDVGYAHGNFKEPYLVSKFKSVTEYDTSTTPSILESGNSITCYSDIYFLRGRNTYIPQQTLTKPLAESVKLYCETTNFSSDNAQIAIQMGNLNSQMVVSKQTASNWVNNKFTVDASNALYNLDDVWFLNRYQSLFSHLNNKPIKITKSILYSNSNCPGIAYDVPFYVHMKFRPTVLSASSLNQSSNGNILFGIWNETEDNHQLYVSIGRDLSLGSWISVSTKTTQVFSSTSNNASRMYNIIRENQINSLTLGIVDSKLSIYLNGFKVTEDVNCPLSAYAEDDLISFYVGCKNNKDITLTNTPFSGNIYEFIMWGRELSDYDETNDKNEVLDISKVPAWYLMYNPYNETYYWSTMPTIDHCRNNWVVKSGFCFNHTGATNARLKLLAQNESVMTNNLAMTQNNTSYKSTNDRLILGKYMLNNGVYEFTKQIQPYNNNSGFSILERFMNDANIPKVKKNMNTFTYVNALNNSSNWSELVVPERLNTYTDIFEQWQKIDEVNNFDGKGATVTTTAYFYPYWINLGLYTPNLNYADGNYLRNFRTNIAIQIMFLGSATSNPVSDGVMRCEIYTYNTSNTQTTLKTLNYSTDQSNMRLKLGHLYRFRLYTGSDWSTWSLKVFSNTDTDFGVEKVLIDFQGISPNWKNASKGKSLNSENSLNVVCDRNIYRFCEISTNFLDYIDGKRQNEIISNAVITKTTNTIQPSIYSPYDTFQVVIPTDSFNKIDIIGAVVNEDTVDNGTVKFLISFDEGATWNYFNSHYTDTSNMWGTITNIYNIDLIENFAIDYRSANTITEYNYNQKYDKTKKTIIRFFIFNSSFVKQIEVENFIVQLDGPIIYDSWEEPGTIYDSTIEWKWLNDESWNIFLPPWESGQNWNNFGSDIPNVFIKTPTNGSVGSTFSNKSFGSTKVKITPKGKWYWKIGAYNGIRKNS